MYLTQLAKMLLQRRGIHPSRYVNHNSEVKASYHVLRHVYCPSVAYVRGLEEYHNEKYRMVCNENTVRSDANNA